jgi:succinate dehydrogenase / fumarate reductase flavoprotein subunit
MQQALDELQTFKQRAARAVVHGNREYNPGWHTALDLDNLLTVSEIIARSALERKESRGAHFREDFPGKDEALGKVNTVVHKDPEGDIQLRHNPIAEMPSHLKEIIEQMK